MSNWSKASFYDWDVERMIMWLREESLHDCIGPFSLKKINGLSFVNLSDFDIKTFQISWESKNKLTKVLKRIKEKRNVHRSIEDESSIEITEPKIPSSIPVQNHHDEGDEGWGSDFDDCEEDEDSGSGSDGEYIEPEQEDGNFGHPESPNKEVPNVPTGLVAQIRAGLNGSIKKNPFKGPPPSHPHPQTPQAEEDDDIYDEPPDDEEVYEQPSDDSGSGVVVRPMSKRKVIRCPSQETGEYIDARPPTNSNQDVGPCPPPPMRPPKPGQKSKGIKPPPMRQPSPPREPEIYDEVPEDEQPGCSQVVEEYEAFSSSEKPSSSHVLEEYEPFPSGGTWDPETYEIPDNGTQETYEVPEAGAEPETYEIPDPEPAPPARPPPRGSGWNPLKKKPAVPDKGKPTSPIKEPVKQKLAKPVPATKPQISPKPSPLKAASVKKTPDQQNKTSRLYPTPSNAAPRPAVSQPPPHVTPAKKEENNNEKNSPSPRVPPQRRPPPTCPSEEKPPSPPPPRPGKKPGAKPSPIKPPKISDSNIPVGPTSPPRNAPLPPLPTQPKSPVDQLKNSPWFHGPLDRTIAENALQSFSKEGAFIVRNSSKDPNNYSMSLFSKGKVRHLNIPRNPNGKFVLGQSGKVPFSTITEMVNYYSQHHVDLKSGGSTSLTAACPLK